MAIGCQCDLAIGVAQVQIKQLSDVPLIFDYQDANNFKYAGAFFGTSEWRFGQYQSGTWNDLQLFADAGLVPNVTYDNVQVLLGGTTATVFSGGVLRGTYDFGVPLNVGKVGLGSRNAIAQFDNLIH